MITQLVIKNVASYDSTGVDIDTNKKINFFFGYNGSGKSTIARFLHDVTLPGPGGRVPAFPESISCQHIGY